MGISVGSREEVPVEKIIEKVVVKEVEVVKRVVREVVATAMPLSGGLAVEQAKYGGTLKVTAQASMKTLNARISFAAVTIVVAIQMHNQLFAWDLNFDSQPQLVNDWSVSPGALTYTFNLRNNVTFHDGSPFTSDDLIASFKAWGKRKSGALLSTFAVDPENPLEAVDAHTVQIQLSKPFCCVLQSFTLPGGTGRGRLPQAYRGTPGQQGRG